MIEDTAITMARQRAQDAQSAAERYTRRTLHENSRKRYRHAVCAVRGCLHSGEEDKAVTVEREKTVQRYDNFLAAASNGRQLASAGAMACWSPRTTAAKSWTREILPSPSSVVAMSACPNGTFAALDFYRKVWIRDAQARNWRCAHRGHFNHWPSPATQQPPLGGRQLHTIVSSSDQGNSWNAGLRAWTRSSRRCSGWTRITATSPVNSEPFWRLTTGAPPGQAGGSAGGTLSLLTGVHDTQHGWVSSLGGTILYTATRQDMGTADQRHSGAAVCAIPCGRAGVGVGGSVRYSSSKAMNG